jgi:hypothetical protein
MVSVDFISGHVEWDVSLGHITTTSRPLSVGKLIWILPRCTSPFSWRKCWQGLWALSRCQIFINNYDSNKNKNIYLHKIIIFLNSVYFMIRYHHHSSFIFSGHFCLSMQMFWRWVFCFILCFVMYSFQILMKKIIVYHWY